MEGLGCYACVPRRPPACTEAHDQCTPEACECGNSRTHVARQHVGSWLNKLSYLFYYFFVFFLISCLKYVPWDTGLLPFSWSMRHLLVCWSWQVKHSATTVDGSPCFYCWDLGLFCFTVVELVILKTQFVRWSHQWSRLGEALWVLSQTFGASRSNRELAIGRAVRPELLFSATGILLLVIWHFGRTWGGYQKWDNMIQHGKIFRHAWTFGQFLVLMLFNVCSLPLFFFCSALLLLSWSTLPGVSFSHGARCNMVEAACFTWKLQHALVSSRQGWLGFRRLLTFQTFPDAHCEAKTFIVAGRDNSRVTLVLATTRLWVLQFANLPMVTTVKPQAFEVETLTLQKDLEVKCFGALKARLFRMSQQTYKKWQKYTKVRSRTRCTFKE